MSALLLLLPLALAAELLPGRALTLPPCTPDPDDACWASAPRLQRFVAPRGLPATAPLGADLRLAHDGDGALLVRADALPPAADEVEVFFGETHARVGAGISVVPVGPRAGAVQGQVRLLGAASPLVWAPSGDPYADEGFPILLADAPALGMPIELVRLDAASLEVIAPGADQLLVTREQADWPRARRGVPDAWQAAGRDRVSVARPMDPGWYRVEARWAELDVAARRLYIPAPDPIPEVSAHGVHPAPAVVEAGEGSAPFRLQPRSAIVVQEPSWDPAARLLSEELGRLLGQAPPIVARRPRDGDIVLGAAGGLPRSVSAAARSMAEAPEGFAVVLGDRAVVAASSLRGATYGALALADALAERPAGPLVLADRPAIETRVLYQELNLSGSGPMDLTMWRAYVRRVVARGRYNTLYLGLRNSVVLPGLPELAHANALAPNELQAMIAEARLLGLAVYPATSTTGHAAWLTAAHPERRSSGGAQAVCLRDPETAALTEAALRELWALFDAPLRVHIGHDEARWPDRQTFGDLRDPYCAGVPASSLFAESLRWHIDLFRAMGAEEIVVWSDMLAADWNGAETHTALSALSPGEVTFAAWSKVGDSLGELGSQGFGVMRVPTGYYDWKRAGLLDEQDQIAGEGVAVFTPFPWMVPADNPSSRGLAHHWSRVLLAGATAWQPALSTVPIRALAAQTAGLPAYQPGASERTALLRPLAISGAPPEAAWPAASAPPFLRLAPAVAREDEPVTVSVGDTIEVLSLLQAVRLTTATRQGVQVRGRTPEAAPPVVEARFRYRDGSTETVGLRYGIETFDVDSGSAAASLWGTAGSVSLGAGRRGWRVDIRNPRPDQEVSAVEVCAREADTAALVFAAAGR